MFTAIPEEISTDRKAKLRAHLRQFTMPDHLLTEGLWTENGHFPSETKYVEFLEQTLFVQLSLGLPAAQICGVESVLLFTTERIKKLQSDINSRITERPRLSLSIDDAWGIQYVLIGSALGSAFMLKRGMLPENWPLSFVKHDYDFVKTGKLYRFFNLLEQQDIDAERTANGARLCFSAFQKKLKYPGWQMGRQNA